MIGGNVIWIERDWHRAGLRASEHQGNRRAGTRTSESVRCWAGMRESERSHTCERLGYKYFSCRDMYFCSG